MNQLLHRPSICVITCISFPGADVAVLRHISSTCPAATDLLTDLAAGIATDIQRTTTQGTPTRIGVRTVLLRVDGCVNPCVWWLLLDRTNMGRCVRLPLYLFDFLSPHIHQIHSAGPNTKSWVVVVFFHGNV